LARTSRLLLSACLAALAVGALPPARAAAEDAVVLRRITVPVEGNFSYGDDFGDPRSGGRTHQGNDLIAPKGRPLLAAADARVRRIHVDNGDGEGNTLVLRDADGWDYVYIHINNDTPGTDDGANPWSTPSAPGSPSAPG
jgi:murein DD-endopeptidase MepM/ murein hydrolase activator NlpD